MTQHQAPPTDPADSALGSRPGPADGSPLPPRPAVVTLVGNPRPGSRTLGAAQAVAARVADHLGLAAGPAEAGSTDPASSPGNPTTATIDLAEIAAEILTPVHPRADAAREIVAGATVLIVATPVYKGSYTGLLKAFLDLYGPDGLAGVVAVPVVVSGNPAHALAGEVHLRPLLVELGATVPARTLALLDSQLSEAELASTVDAWLDRAGGPLLRAASAAVGQDVPTHQTAPELAEVTR
ncbi:NADPH-dependent FMN reductase [Oerskovia enterophila]|uniref:NADPH-dependent FMN reductase n=1 Tax=Oerskovia enterophila TaxID=43678 RepID=UPI003814EB97